MERRTLCALERESMAAAVHLHRFGPGSEVSQDLRNSARIRWVLSWPERHEAAVALMGAARQCIREWASASEYATMVLPIPGFVGVPGVCPHVGAALRAAGFRPEPGDHHREVWGGRIGAAAATPEAPPVEGLRLARAVGHWWQGTELGAVRDLLRLDGPHPCRRGASPRRVGRDHRLRRR